MKSITTCSAACASRYRSWDRLPACLCRQAGSLSHDNTAPTTERRGHMSILTWMDWAVIGVTSRFFSDWPGGSFGRTATRLTTTSWRDATSAGGSLAARSSHRTSVRNTWWDWPGPGRPMAWPWRITSCMPGACWCWRGCSCRSTCGRRSSRCRSSWNGDSIRRAVGCCRSLPWWLISSRKWRWAFTPVAWCSQCCCPKCESVALDSFWVGSILVVVLTGIYTILGGLRTVAYTEAMQTAVLVIGSALVSVFGLAALGGWHQPVAAESKQVAVVEPQQAEATDSAAQSRRMGTSAEDLRLGDVQPVEAARADGNGGDLGARE